MKRPADDNASGLGWAVVGFTNAYATYVSTSGTEVLRWARLIGLVNSFAFVPLLGLTALILLLFPDGRPPSRRWRWLAWAIGVLVVATTIAGAVLPADAADPIQNPLAVEGSIGAVADAVANVGVTALFLAILVSAGSLLLRFRRARGLERQQLKWLTYGGAFLAAYVALDMVSLTPAGVVDALIEALTFGALYVGVGMAVLRYRLYDIDRLINRTLVYGLLTAVLGLAYAGAVLVLGELFGGVAGNPPSWAVAGTTLTVAALFQPARRRIQQAVDRRFNRRRYDMARTSNGSAPACGMRSTWTRCRPSCSGWWIRRWSPPRRRSGYGRRLADPCSFPGDKELWFACREGVAAVGPHPFRLSEEEIVRRIFVLSAVFLMVLAAGPAAWADTSRRRGISARRSAGRGTTRRRPTSRAFVGEWHRAGGSSRESPERRRAPRAPDQLSQRVSGTGPWSHANAATCPGPTTTGTLPGGRHPTPATTRSTPRRGTSWSSTRPARPCRVGARGNAGLAEGRPGGEQARLHGGHRAQPIPLVGRSQLRNA